jgi:glycogen debranching enzyme
MARCREIPHTPYYGNVDATPLWLLLYAEYHAGSSDRTTIKELWDVATAAMSWIDSQCAETGYLSYQRRSPGGIDNQRWKDSGNAIVNGKGEQVFGPIALCEVQAYVYAAKQHLSHIAKLIDQSELAERWRSQYRDLQTRFNRDFWIESADYCALASVWSHDSALVAIGLRSLGWIDQALAVAEGLFEMTRHQSFKRPPELFCGYQRCSRPPINYPIVCSPQAWATGSISNYCK